jgi:hypothetical protein
MNLGAGTILTITPQPNVSHIADIGSLRTHSTNTPGANLNMLQKGDYTNRPLNRFRDA